MWKGGVVSSRREKLAVRTSVCVRVLYACFFFLRALYIQCKGGLLMRPSVCDRVRDSPRVANLLLLEG